MNGLQQDEVQWDFRTPFNVDLKFRQAMLMESLKKLHTIIIIFLCPYITSDSCR